MKQSPGKSLYALLLILALALAVRLVAVEESRIWFDEAISLFIADNPPLSIISNSTSVTVNPPLYYLLLHAWNLFADGETAARLMSIIFSLGVVIMVYLLGRRLRGDELGLTAAFLCALSPFQVYYAQELRMYSLLSFLSAGIIYSTVGIIGQDRPRDWLALVAFSAAGVYTHYFAGLVALVSIGLIGHNTVGNRAGLLKTAACGLLIVGLFAPWLPSFAANTGDAYEARVYAPQAHYVFNPLLSLAGTLKTLSVGGEATASFTDPLARWALIAPGSLIFLFLFALGLTAFSRQRLLLLVSLFIFVPLLLVTLVSFRMSLYANRYLIIISVPFYLAVAQGMLEISRRRSLFGLMGLLLALLLIGANVNRHFNPAYGREECRAAVDYIQQEFKAGERVAHLSLFTLYPFMRYDRGFMRDCLLTQKASKGGEGLIRFQTATFASLSEERLWLVIPTGKKLLEAAAPWYPSQEGLYKEEMSRLREAGYQDIDRYDFRGISVLLMQRFAPGR